MCTLIFEADKLTLLTKDGQEPGAEEAELEIAGYCRFLY